MITTLAEAQAHQRKHGFLRDNNAIIMPQLSEAVRKPRMNKTETEYSLILEAMKRRGEIHHWKFEGISLSWGIDPASGKPMWYTPDFFVVRLDVSRSAQLIKLIEVKGGHIRDRDLVRFKGCRSDWPMFEFELHQKKAGQWQRIH